MILVSKKEEHIDGEVTSPELLSQAVTKTKLPPGHVRSCGGIVKMEGFLHVKP